MPEPESPPRESDFGKADRTTGFALLRQAKAALADPCVQVVLEAVQGQLLILNRNRQILAANHELLEALHRETPDSLVGFRPGEALNCVHFTEGFDGCGTSPHCRTCGAVLAILASQADQRRAQEECRLSGFQNGALVALDYRVTATPLNVNGEALTAFVMVDISSEKRRQVLEHTFLHDVMNSLGGIEGWSRMMRDVDPRSAAQEIVALAETLKEEVLSHRTLLAAERGEFTVHARPCNANEVLRALRRVFENHPVARNRELEVSPARDEPAFVTDRTLLLRVLINMVKNAFEATTAGQTVRVWFECKEGHPSFFVENPGEIDVHVRPHIFERSYSTKAAKGRGIGTYSMKLFGERFLKGKVDYSCQAGVTRFRIRLPPNSTTLPVPVRVTPPATVAQPPQPPRGNETKHILFAEDDDSMFRLGTLFLTRLGYKVTGCQDGAEAVAAFCAAPASFDLVLTDGQLPGKPGYELARRVHELRPDLPVILCTGGVEVSGALLKEQGFYATISKPFSVASLTQVLNEAFSQTGSPERGSTRP